MKLGEVVNCMARKKDKAQKQSQRLKRQRVKERKKTEKEKSKTVDNLFEQFEGPDPSTVNLVLTRPPQFISHSLFV